jgi:hypothetical protein
MKSKHAENGMVGKKGTTYDTVNVPQRRTNMLVFRELYENT